MCIQFLDPSFISTSASYWPIMASHDSIYASSLVNTVANKTLLPMIRWPAAAEYYQGLANMTAARPDSKDSRHDDTGPKP